VPFLVNDGDLVEARISDGGVGSVLVPAIARGAANLGESVDCEPVADRKPLLVGLTLTTGASNIGEARISAAGLTTFNTVGTTFQTGLASTTPLPFSTWDTQFWSFDQATNSMSISTAVVRATSELIPVPFSPQDLRLDLTDDVGFNITWEIYQKTLGGSFPLLPDVIRFSLGNGTRQVLIVAGSSLPGFLPGAGAIHRHVVTTKGGGNASYQLHDWHYNFQLP